jgi:hypothetical protein
VWHGWQRNILITVKPGNGVTDDDSQANHHSIADRHHATCDQFSTNCCCSYNAGATDCHANQDTLATSYNTQTSGYESMRLGGDTNRDMVI